MKSWLTVLDLAEAPAAEIHINGFIGESWWDDSGTSERQFIKALDGIPSGRKINLYFNSEGGSVKDGLGIHAAIKRRAQDITAINTGYALSIMSYIALAAHKVITPTGSLWMLHKPWSGQIGNANDMRKAAEMLDKHEGAMIPEYSTETGQSRERIAADLEAETWLTGEEAVAYGLADELSGEPITSSRAIDSRAQSRFRRMPVALGGKTPPPTQHTTPENKMEPTATAEPKAPASPSPAAPANVSQAPIAAATPNQDLDVKALAAALAGVQAQQAREKTGRIAKAVDQAVLDGKIPVAQAANWKKRAEADETILEDLANMESRRVGTEPASGSRIQFSSTSFAIDLIRAKPQAERRAYMEANWNELCQAETRRQFAPFNANTGTTDSALIGTMLSEVTITVLQTMLAPLRAFTTDVGINPMAPRQPVVVSVVTTGGTAQSNATNFEDLTNFVGTVMPITVTPTQITAGGNITNAERNSGFRMSMWAEIKAAELAQKVMGAVTAVITIANFPGVVTPVASTAFTVTDLNKLWGGLSKAPTKYAILASTYIAKLLPIDQNSLSVLGGNWPGWAGIFANDYWVGATANTQGFICHPQAIAAAVGYPATSPNAANAGARESLILIPGIDVQVLKTEWYSNSSRNDWTTLDLVFGAAKADQSAGLILPSA